MIGESITVLLISLVVRLINCVICARGNFLVFVLHDSAHLIFLVQLQATETGKEGEILPRNEKKRMERCLGQIKIIVILFITFDLR